MIGYAILSVALGAITLALGPGLLGYRSVPVHSSGLEPFIPRGALMIQEPVPAGQLRSGDVITFAQDRLPGVILTHRVLEVRPVSGGAQLHTAALDGGEVEVWLVDPAQVVGRLLYWMPWAGALTTYPGAPWGWPLLLGLGTLTVWGHLRARRSG